MNRYRQLTHAKSGDAGTGRGAAAAAKLDAAWQRESSLRAQARHMTGRKRALAREWGVAILLFYFLFPGGRAQQPDSEAEVGARGVGKVRSRGRKHISYDPMTAIVPCYS